MLRCDHEQDVALTLSRYLVATEPIRVAGGPLSRVILSTRSGATIVVSELIWQSACAADWDAIPDPVLRALREQLVAVSTAENELRTVLDDNSRAIAADLVLEQVIQPSAACQLGCDYCGQEHRAIHMSPQVQSRLLERIEQRLANGNSNGEIYETLRVGWFGAEPLLGLGAMRRLSPSLSDLAKKYNARYASRVVTNGLRLTPVIARELQERHSVEHVEITLDGTANVHDQRRATKSGKPSFDRIFGNLVAIASCDYIKFVIAVRCNVDQFNVENVPELIDQIADAGIHERVGLYFSPVYDWGNGAQHRSIDSDEYASREVMWFGQMMRRGFHVDLIPPRRKIVCLAVRPGGTVTDARGNEFNCTEAPQVPSYGDPNRYSTGTVSGEKRAEPYFRSFGESIAKGEVGCGSCQLLPVCGGACPKSWSDGQAACPSHKRNIAERVLLEFARSRIGRLQESELHRPMSV